MEDEKFNCPACCNEVFTSKESLLEHLRNILGSLHCPICNSQWSSLVHLTEHLSVDNCQQDGRVTDHSEIVYETESRGVDEKNSIENINENIKNEAQNIVCNMARIDPLDTPIESGEVSKMYVEMLNKQLMKPCLQTQEFKLVKVDGVSRYLIFTEPESGVNLENTIVTKQNNDGTISMTTMKDMKLEEDPATTPTDNEPDDGQEEIYSCNTCGVSFSSVLEHIQNYHNDQEVVVEEPIEEGDNDIPLEYDSLENDDVMASGDNQISRRVITETGDIVEAPLSIKSDSIQDDSNVPNNATKEIIEPQGQTNTTRFLQFDNFIDCDSLVKDIKETGKKGGPYHKVVMKEVKSQSGTTVKMYHCVTCDIYVSNLNEFKTHPCKILKYSCPHCPVVYENSKSLCAHMKVHKSKTENNTETPVSYECDLCCTVFPTNKSLKLHKRMHDPLKARPIELPVENKDGSEVSNTRYLCPICNKMIPLDYRIVHQNSHKNSNMFNCGICNKKFSSNDYLEMHMNVHNLDKVTVSKQDKSLPYNCLYCNRRFARPHEKVKHERIHTGEKPHSCEICGKSFRVSYCLTLHMRTHTGARPYACQYCGKRFKAHSVYNHHLLTHSDVRAYKCPYCPKAFKTSVQLAGHKNSHTKPFSCQHCNRPFASLYAVRIHTETHARQNNLKFSCSLCGASYARAFALKDHIKQVHKQDVDSPNNLASQEEDWALKQTEGMQSFNKEISDEVTELSLNSNELIVP